MTYFDFQPLRYKGPNATADVDTDDPDWFGLGLPPNTGRYTYASVEAGDFTISIRRQRAGTIVVTATTTRVAETAAQLAAASVVVINAAIAADTAATGWAKYAYAASYPGSGDAYYVHWKVEKPDFYVSTTAPGSATHIAAPGDRWPIARVIPFGQRVGSPPCTDVEFLVVALDSNGVQLAPSGTYSLEVVEGIHHAEEPQWLAATRGEVSGSFGEIHGVQCSGAAELGVRLSTISEPANTDTIMVLYRTAIT